MIRERVLIFLTLFFCVLSGYLYFISEEDRNKNRLQKENDLLRAKADSLEEFVFCLELNYDTLELERDSLKVVSEKEAKSIDSLQTALDEANNSHYTDINSGEAVDILTNIEFEAR